MIEKTNAWCLHWAVVSWSVLFKDARSVYLYPYIWSQILQYVKYTKSIYIAKEITNVFLDKK